MRTLLLASLFGLAVACGSSSDPRIVRFTASSTDTTAGDNVTLSWEVTNADSVDIDPIGKVAGTEIVVSPAVTTTYAMTASRGEKKAIASVTVNVKPGVPQARITLFKASPPQILAGGKASLEWSVANAAQVTITADAGTSPGDQAASGKIDVTPAATTAYTLSIKGQALPAPVTVRVRVVAAPAIASFAADKPSTTAGDAVTLSWSGSATGFGLDNGIGFLGAATSTVARPGATTTYTLTAYGPAGGIATRTATVTITGPAPAGTLSYADPTSVPADAVLKLVKVGTAGAGGVTLALVTTQAVSAAALALDLRLDGTRAALDAQLSGDASPGFSVSAGALDPGSAPVAAKAVLRGGVLTLGIAQKPSSPGAVPAKALPSGTEVCRIRLVPAANSQPGGVLPQGADPYKAFLGALPRDTTTAKVALGTLTLL